MYDDSNAEIVIDFGRYIRSLVREWYVILLFGLLAGAAVFFYFLLKPTTYTAEANVSILQLRSEISFANEFTRTEEDGAGDRTLEARLENRRAALETLAASPALHARVYSILESTQGGDEKLSSGGFQVEVNGDVLKLLVTHKDPAIAAQLANVWSGEYVKLANQAYVNTGSDLEASRLAADEAFIVFAEARLALKEFTIEDPAQALLRERTDLDNLVRTLRLDLNQAFVIANTAPISLSNRLLLTTQTIINDQVDLTVQKELATLSEQYNYWQGRQQTLLANLSELEKIEAQLQLGLRQQSEVINEGVRENLVGTGLGELGTENILQFDITSLVMGAESVGVGEASKTLLDLFPEFSSDDVDKLIQAAQAELEVANENVALYRNDLLLSNNIATVPLELPADNLLYDLIDTRVQETLNKPILLDPRSPLVLESLLYKQIEELENYQRDLDGQIFSLETDKEILQRDFDNARDLFSALDNKAKEVAAQLATGAPQVRVAITASRPIGPDRNSGNLIPIAIAIGLFVGIAIVFLREAIRLEPPTSNEDLRNEESASPGQADTPTFAD